MREIVRTTQFKRDFKKVAKSGWHAVNDFLDVVEKLARDIPLPEKISGILDI